MPLINATSNSTGTGNLTIEGLTANIANGTSLEAFITNNRDFGAAAYEWEFSNVTYDNGVIVRNSVINSSSNGTLIDFSVGTKIINLDYPTGVTSANGTLTANLINANTANLITINANLINANTANLVTINANTANLVTINANTISMGIPDANSDSTSEPASMIHIESGESLFTTYDTDAPISDTRPAWQFGGSAANFSIYSTNSVANTASAQANRIERMRITANGEFELNGKPLMNPIVASIIFG